MSLEQKIEQTKIKYDTITRIGLQRELKHMGKGQGREIKKISSEKLSNWSQLDDFDKSCFKSIFYRLAGWTAIVMGFQRVVGIPSNAEAVGWKPSWNKNTIVRLFMIRKGIPIYLIGSMFILPDMLFQFTRVGLKHYNLELIKKEEEDLKLFNARLAASKSDGSNKE